MNKQYNYPYFEEWGDASYLSGNQELDVERFKRSEQGRYLAASRSLMSRFTDVDDPRLIQLWKEKGVVCEVRQVKGSRWLYFCPAEETKEKLPVMLVYRPADLLAEAFYDYMIEQSAQGEFILAIFSTEDFEENEAMNDILDEILSGGKADPSRVYVTGHSHYGEFAMEFTRRHHERIAACCQQGDTAGIILDFYGMTKEKADLMATYDMPISNVAGCAEFNGIFPINQDAPGVPEDSPYRKSAFPMTKEKRVEDWKVRLQTMRCPVPSDEEIYAAGRNKVEKMLGFPCDRTELFYAEGSEVYIGDIQNIDGKYHFRTVAIENVPHTTTHLMHILTWAWARRFARDLETGEVVELYEI